MTGTAAPTSLRDTDSVTDVDKAKTTALFDAVGLTYDEVLPMFSFFGDGLVKAAKVGLGDHVLDVASGRGACVFPASAVTGLAGRVEGIDLSQRMVGALSREIESRAMSNARSSVMDAEELLFDDETFDVVLCAFAVFFFPDRRRAFLEFARVLKQDGTLAISIFEDKTFGYPWFDELATTFRGSPVPNALGRVDVDVLTDELHECGFEVLDSHLVVGTFHFASAEQHWQWPMSHGPRLWVETLDERTREALKAATSERIELHRDGEGLRFDKPVRFTLARRSAPPSLAYGNRPTTR